VIGNFDGFNPARAARVSSWVLKLFIKARVTVLFSACRMMMSRKDIPSLTSIKDLVPVNPMLVPRPPLRMIRTV